jgi:16S rRNA (guanine1207-N2)-methyltransferase
MSSPLASLLKRHAEDLQGPQTWIFPTDADDLVECTAWGAQPAAVSIFRDAFQALEDARLPQAWGWRSLAGLPAAPVAIVPFPKSKELLALALHTASRVVGPGGTVRVVGHNRSGIRNAGPTLAAWLDEVEQADNARHCILFDGRARAVADEPSDADLGLTSWPVALPSGPPLTVLGCAGVFAHGRLDEGTAILLRCLPPLTGAVLDLGCGSGVIGAAVARGGARVTFSDTSELALESTRRTLAANGLSAERLVASDGFGEVEGLFDHIVSNPPFHEGFSVDLGPTLRMIADAPRFLRPGGTFTLVANRFLKYADPLQAAFGGFRVLHEDARFRVYQAVRPGERGRTP